MTATIAARARIVHALRLVLADRPPGYQHSVWIATEEAAWQIFLDLTPAEAARVCWVWPGCLSERPRAPEVRT